MRATPSRCAPGSAAPASPRPAASAACAAAVCAARKDGHCDRTVTVTLPGGPLGIEWRADDHILMTGPAELEYDGVLERSVLRLRPGRRHRIMAETDLITRRLIPLPSSAPALERRHRRDATCGVELITLGCRLNAYESEVMRGHAAAAGLGDAVIVNTCAVTAEAVRQAAQTIRKAAAREPDGAHHRHRLRGADRAGALRRHARGRSRHRQCREDAGRDLRRPWPSATAPRVAVNDIMSVRETARASDRRLRHRARAPTCRCRTAATTAAPSASFPTAAARRARCRPARSWPRSAAWSKPATPRSC